MDQVYQLYDQQFNNLTERCMLNWMPPWHGYSGPGIPRIAKIVRFFENNWPQTCPYPSQIEKNMDTIHRG